MDDLQINNYYLGDNMESLTAEHIAILMRIYAKLHATTLVIKHEKPFKLAKFQKMTDIFVKRANDPFLKNYLENLRKHVLDSVSYKEEHQHWKCLNEFLESNKTAYDLMMEYLQPNSSEPYTTVCHGDCWINNLMFKKVVRGDQFLTIFRFFICKSITLVFPSLSLRSLAYGMLRFRVMVPWWMLV